MKYIASTLLLCSVTFAQEGNLLSDAQSKPMDMSNQQETTFFCQGDAPLSADIPASYNAPAGVLLLNDDGCWMPDLSVDLSFLYYYAQEDGLNIANSGQIVHPSSTYLVTSGVSNGTFLTQDFTYKPAFQIGINSNIHEWLFRGEYTWIRQTTQTSQAAPTPQPTVTGIGVWIVNNWFAQINPTSAQSMAGTSASSTWHLGMDIGDLMLGRPYYQGRYLTVSPFFGLRAAWIRQQFNVDLAIPGILNSGTSTTITSTNNSNSWGIGPKAGLGAACLLGAGFRLEGDVAASVLYTEYTHVTHSENSTTSSTPSTIGIKLTNYQTVRPELEMGFGLGWGTYLANHHYHLDFSAGYNFQVFWNQNMMRQIMDETTTGVSPGANNLYLQGLNLTLRFDF